VGAGVGDGVGEAVGLGVGAAVAYEVSFVHTRLAPQPTLPQQSLSRLLPGFLASVHQANMLSSAPLSGRVS
jgi:hypothetical protein